MTPRKGTEGEEHVRVSAISGMKSDDGSQATRELPFKLSLDAKFRTIEANNMSKLRHITSKPTATGKKTLAARAKAKNAGTRDHSRLSFTHGRKHVASHPSMSIKTEGHSNSYRGEPQEPAQGKSAKSHFYDHIFASTKIHARNSSANSLRDKMALGEVGSFKHDSHNVQRKKEGSDVRHTMFNKKGSPFRHRP